MPQQNDISANNVEVKNTFSLGDTFTGRITESMTEKKHRKNHHSSSSESIYKIDQDVFLTSEIKGIHKCSYKTLGRSTISLEAGDIEKNIIANRNTQISHNVGGGAY